LVNFEATRHSLKMLQRVGRLLETAGSKQGATVNPKTVEHRLSPFGEEHLNDSPGPIEVSNLEPSILPRGASVRGAGGQPVRREHALPRPKPPSVRDKVHLAPRCSQFATQASNSLQSPRAASLRRGPECETNPFLAFLRVNHRPTSSLGGPRLQNKDVRSIALKFYRTLYSPKGITALG